MIKKKENLILAAAVIFVLVAAGYLLLADGDNKASDTVGLIQHVSEYNFKNKVLRSDSPVLVNFWATWCSACRMLSPVIAEVAQEMKGQVKIMKLDVDEAKSLAQTYKIESLPTLVLFKQGKETKRLKGYVPKETIIDFIEN
jgi:thioredoxin 1